MNDERKRLDELLKLMIQERLDNMLFITEDDDEEPPQLSWLSGQGAQDLEDRRPGAYYNDSEMHLPWDDKLKELGHLLAGVALEVIDHYKEKPSFTKEAAKKEILEAVGVPLDVFMGKYEEFGEFYSLDQIIEEEFQDVNENYNELGNPEATRVDLDIDGGSSATMGDISENNTSNRNHG